MPTKTDGNDAVTDDMTNDTIAADAPAEDVAATEAAPSDAAPEQAPGAPADPVLADAVSEAPVDSIPVGLSDPPQVALPVEAPPPEPTPEPTVNTFIYGGGDRIVHLRPEQKLEVFDGDGWAELTERRPDVAKMRGYRSPPGIPEGYVRATPDYIMLWPSLADDTLFRITSPG